MRIDVITLMPEFLVPVTSLGVVGRAVEAGRVTVKTWNPRDFTSDRHRTVDDRPYGGGPGMVMKVEPLQAALNAARADQGSETRVSLLSPQGRVLTQSGVRDLENRTTLILFCGRYEGIDERFVDMEVEEEISIGDYVVSGGEPAAAVLIDAVTRLLPGVLGDETSAVQDSFTEGLLDYPHYTRPERVAGLDVPDVLLSGDHAAVARWRRMQALGRTREKRPELLKQMTLDDEDKALLEAYQRAQESENSG